MNLTERALRAVDEAISVEARKAHMERFLASGYDSEIMKPLLCGKGRIEQKFCDLAKVPLQNMSSICIENTSDETISINMSVDLKGDATTVLELLDRFVRCTAHTNHLGDFRVYPGFYTRVFRGQRYLLGHGDGHCVALGFLFQGACRALLDQHVGLNYCYSERREFTHLFATWKDPDGVNMYIDPDQKGSSQLDEMEGYLPRGFLFQLISQSGLALYRNMKSEGLGWLFPKMTKQNFTRQGVGEMAVFEKKPNFEKLGALFESAFNNNREPVNIEEDDYSWKKEYRGMLDQRTNSRSHFMADLDSCMPYLLPAGARLEIGFGFSELPLEVADLCTVFFGRVPATVRLNVTRDHPVKILLTEFPWLIFASIEVSSLSVNNHILQTRMSKCERFSVVGMADIEPFLDWEAEKLELEIVSNLDSELGIVIPINAFALNSGFASIYADAESLEVSALTVR